MPARSSVARPGASIAGRVRGDIMTAPVSSNVDLTQDEMHQIQILMEPALWAKAYMGWTARDYQEEALRSGGANNLNVMRKGRRLGKTEVLCILILWHAFVQPNKKKVVNPTDDQYNVLIVTPGEAQIKLIFDRLEQLINSSAILKACVARTIEHRIDFTNGSVIKGLTAGSKSNTGAQNTRGQRADLIVLDEVDYMQENDITNLVNIRNEAPGRIRVLAASTPSGKRASFYRWCTNANNRGGNNGWREHYAPSTVNPEVYHVNPDTGITFLEEFRLELPAARFAQEVMAEFGEETGGVYRKVDIDRAVYLGRDMKLTYAKGPRVRKGPRVLGVDWDKSQAGVSMASVEWDYSLMRFVPFHAEEIPRTEFTLDNGVNRVMELDALHEYDYIVVDRGFGEYQVERLTKLLDERQKGSHKKLIPISLSEKIDVRNPVTRQIESVDIKPWIVNQSVLQFERGMIALNPHDRKMIEQLEGYRVISVGADGRPKYSKINEHFVDALNFAIYGIVMKFSDITKVQVGRAIGSIARPLDSGKDIPVKDRDITETAPKKTFGIGFIAIGKNGGPPGRGGSNRNLPTRRRF